MLMKNYRLKRQSNILIWTFEHTRGSFAITLFLDVVFYNNLVYIFGQQILLSFGAGNRFVVNFLSKD